MFLGASPLVFVSLLAGGTSAALALYAWLERTEPGSTAFAVLMGGATVWSVAYAVALTTFDPALRLAMELPIEVGKALIAPAWLAFALGYTGRAEYLTRRTVAALALVPVATLLVVALPALRPLIWTGYRITPTLGAATVSYDPGVWHFGHAAYGYVLVGAGMALLIDTLASNGSLYRDQTLALVVGSVVPTVAHLKRTFQVGPYVAVDFTPMALAVTGLTFGYALFRFDLFDLVPATSHRGRRSAIDDLGVGVAIVTADDRVVELNDEARRLFAGAEATVGDPLSAFVPAHATDGGTVDVSVDGRRRTLEVVPADIDDPRGGALGRTVAFHDVTDREARRQRLEVLNRVLRHNLRNEMTAVMGYAELLAESLDGAEARHARTIQSRSDALVSLSEKARGVESMLESADETTASLPVADVVADVVREVPDRATVEVDVPADLTVAANEEVLRTVLSALVENAVDHTDAAAPWVAVSARREAPAADAPAARDPSATSRGAPATRAATVTDGGADDAGENRADDAGESGGVGADDAGERGADGAGENRADDAAGPGAPTAGGVVIEVRDDGPGIPDHELAVVTGGEETPLDHGSGLGLWVVQWGSRWLGADVEFETDDSGTTVRLHF